MASHCDAFLGEERLLLFSSVIKTDGKKVCDSFTCTSAAVSGLSWQGLSHVDVAPSAMGSPGSSQGPRGWIVMLHGTFHIIPEFFPAVMLHLQGCVIVKAGHTVFQKNS